MKKIEAIDALGGTAKLARALNITPQAISQWGENVPALRAYEIQEIVNRNKHNPLHATIVTNSQSTDFHAQ
jgi:transcriptional repressor of cell division inhibition gene dicB